MSKHIYIAQSSAGSNDGSSAANAHSVSWFNTSGNWGAGGTQISPGDTVHLCGTITSQLQPQGSGTSGNLITILWESGAKLSQPAGTLIAFGALGYLRFDGGTNGIIENTDNGTALGNQSGVSGIYSQSATYIEVANLTFRNLYVHTATSDAIIDEASNAALYLGASVGLVVQNCTFSDVCWAIYASGGGPSTIQDCTFSRYDHGFATGTAPFTVQRCHFGTTANWDSDANRYHHDGIHCFFPGGLKNDGPNLISECYFDGDWGANNTAHVFIEGNWNHDDPLSVNNTTIRNNVFVQDPSATHVLNDNFVTGGGHNWVVANNTFIGANVALQGAASIGGDNVVFKNNLVIGVNTFVGIGATDMFASGGCDYNLYVHWGPGGNSPYYYGPAPFYPADPAAGFTTWKSLSGQDAHSAYISTTSLAGINSDGTLASGSAAIGAGADLSALFTIDHNGTTRATPWDIGAYKYGAGGGGDTTAPTPNPSTIASVTANSSSQITVVASTATDAGSPPVEYNFAINGTYQGWQSSATKVFTGLTASTSYAFKVKVRDSASTPNETTESGTTNVSTLSAGGLAPARQLSQAIRIFCGAGF